MPWLSTQGLIVSDADGLLRAADPPEPVDHDEALEILGRRYLAGYGRFGDVANGDSWRELGINQPVAVNGLC